MIFSDVKTLRRCFEESIKVQWVGIDKAKRTIISKRFKIPRFVQDFPRGSNEYPSDYFQPLIFFTKKEEAKLVKLLIKFE